MAAVWQDDLAAFWNRFAVRSFAFTIKWKTSLERYTFDGSALRGALGWSLRSLVCDSMAPGACQSCNASSQCPYALIYETAAGTDNRPLNCRDVPKPTVFIPQMGEGQSFTPGEISSFTVVLVGDAVHLLRALAAATALLGERGVRGGRGMFTLQSVVQLQPPTSPTTIWDTIADPLAFYGRTRTTGFEHLAIEDFADIPLAFAGVRRVELHFVTPLRMEENGRLCRKAPSFKLLIERIAGRVDMLAQLYAGCRLPDTVPLKAWASQVRVMRDQTDWYDWQRHSSRSGRQMFGGLVGCVAYEGDDLTPFVPFLHAGAVLGTGKGAPMGMGRYYLVPVPGDADDTVRASLQ